MENYVAKTFLGLEGVLAEELNALGAQNIETINRAVSFDCDLPTLYKANMSLRSCVRILHPLGVERVRNQDQLYNFAKQINWLRWFTPEQTFAVYAVVNNAQAFNNNLFVALKVKDAIADQFRQIKGARPNIDKANPDVGIHVHIYGEQCTLSIDCSGGSLHRRGYRTGGHAAPLNEVLAAGMVLLSGWDKNSPFVDFMCGSGTLVTEAGLLASNKAPNVGREVFGFHHWKNFDQELFEQTRQELLDAEIEWEHWIYGSDIEPRAISEARVNITNATVDDVVRLSIIDFKDRPVPAGEPGTIIINPPYGERLKSDELNLLYKRIGDTLKQNYAGYTAWILSSNSEATKCVGLKATKRLVLYNGALECRFLKYELYKGRKEE